MALLANGSSRHTSPLRYLGAASALVMDQGNWYRRGARNNFFTGEATSPAANKAAMPEGYLHPTAWVLPMKPGGMASRARILGTSEITDGNLAGGLNADAALDGAGDITDAALALIVSAVANLTGSTAFVGDIVGKLEAAADLSGTSTVTAALAALADLVAALVGAGDVTDAVLTGKGNMSADVVVTGELLNTANVGAAVWQYLIEAGWTAEEIVRVVASAAAAKSSGFPAGPGVFRDLNDTKDRITATMDGDGNRTGITYDKT